MVTRSEESSLAEQSRSFTSAGTENYRESELDKLNVVISSF